MSSWDMGSRKPIPWVLSKMPGISSREVKKDAITVDGPVSVVTILCDGLALESKQQLIMSVLYSKITML